MIRSLLAAALLGAAALVSVPAAAQAQAPYVAITPPMPTDSGGKIEVVEFFWYGCPACFSFEPQLEAWVKKLPKDVEFRRIPAVFNQQVAIAARVHYALEAIGEVDRLHRPLFDAIHKQGLKITDDRQRNEWLERQKVDMAKFNAAYKSFAVESRLKRAAELQQASKIDGVPSIIVNGQYSVAYGDRTLAVTDGLIEQLRKQAAPAAAAAPAKKK
jgi:thiol:disulfide interchange protein DsbA